MSVTVTDALYILPLAAMRVGTRQLIGSYETRLNVTTAPQAYIPAGISPTYVILTLRNSFPVFCLVMVSQTSGWNRSAAVRCIAGSGMSTCSVLNGTRRAWCCVYALNWACIPIGLCLKISYLTLLCDRVRYKRCVTRTGDTPQGNGRRNAPASPSPCIDTPSVLTFVSPVASPSWLRRASPTM